jgi:hypothetical protein
MLFSFLPWRGEDARFRADVSASAEGMVAIMSQHAQLLHDVVVDGKSVFYGKSPARKRRGY